MENLTPEGDSWHLPEAFSISCQAQRRVIVGCVALFTVDLQVSPDVSSGS